MTFTVISSISLMLGGAPNTISEDFSVTTSGENLLWECPAIIATDGDHYEMFYTIISASVYVEYLGLPFGPVDVTDMIPAELLVTWQPANGPMPLDFMWHEVITPPDQDPPSLSFDWIVEVDASGHIVWIGENLYLGEAEYDLGWPWGTVTVQITEGTINANLEISTVENPCYEDVDGNGEVNVSDLLTLISNWGLCPGCNEEIPGDVNYDSAVNVTDLLLIVAAWGPCQ